MGLNGLRAKAFERYVPLDALNADFLGELTRDMEGELGPAILPLCYGAHVLMWGLYH